MLQIAFYFTAVASYFMAVLYFVHMFQLNGYHRDAQNRWLFSNLGVICARLTFAFLSFAVSFFANNTSLLLCCLLNAISVYFLIPGKAKKPLVYTARIKRLFFTSILIFALSLLLCVFTEIFFVTTLIVVLSNFVLMLSDILNAPFERAVKQYYINDAKKILKSHKNLKVIGITGSYGKTSTKYCLSHLLSTKYNVLMTPASYNTPMGIVKTVRQMLKPSCEIFVCEMGAKYKGDIKELCDIVNPDIAIITSVGPQHLESFKTIENVTDTKFELADALSQDETVYLNYDNEYIKTRNVTPKVVSYALDEQSADCIAKNIRYTSSGTTFDVVYKQNTYTFTTKLLGKHNVQNIAGCIAIAIDLGVEPDELALAVKRLEPVSHRLQLIDAGNVTIIDDAFNANPDGTRAALSVLDGFDGTKIIVTPGMIELGKQQDELNFQFGENCAKVCDYIFIVGKTNDKSIYEGAVSAGFNKENIAKFDYVEDAVNAARAIQTNNKRKFVLLENDLPDNY